MGIAPFPDGLDGLIGDRRIDTAFTDLVRDADGRVRVRTLAPGQQHIARWGIQPDP